MTERLTWQQVAAQLAQTGFPLLGRALGGQIPIIGSIFGGTLGETIGQQIAHALALALGVPATPEAVSRAIETKPTSEVISKLQGIEAEAAAKWPALAQIAASDAAADVEIEKVSIERAKVNQETYRDNVRAEVALNDPMWTMYRGLLMWFSSAAIAWGVGVILFGVTFSDAIARRIADNAEPLVYALGVCGAILGLHFATRMGERRAAVKIEPPDVVAETAVVKK